VLLRCASCRRCSTPALETREDNGEQAKKKTESPNAKSKSKSKSKAMAVTVFLGQVADGGVGCGRSGDGDMVERLPFASERGDRAKRGLLGPFGERLVECVVTLLFRHDDGVSE